MLPFVIIAVILAAVGGFVVARQFHHSSEGDKTPPSPPAVAVTTPPPVKTEPAKTEPVKTEPAKTEPVKTEPVKTEPEPVKTEPPVAVTAPITGDVSQVFLDQARDVQKGDRLFELTHVTSNPDKARQLKTRIAELEKITNKDYGDFVPASVVEASSELAKTRKELAGLTKVQRVVVVAARAGRAEPRVARGATVKAGATLAEITPASQ